MPPTTSPTTEQRLYAPLTPSPLNPHVYLDQKIQRHQAKPTITSKRQNPKPNSSTLPQKYAALAQASPTERLLRQKAALAWRCETLRNHLRAHLEYADRSPYRGQTPREHAYPLRPYSPGSHGGGNVSGMTMTTTTTAATTSNSTTTRSKIDDRHGRLRREMDVHSGEYHHRRWHPDLVIPMPTDNEYDHDDAKDPTPTTDNNGGPASLDEHLEEIDIGLATPAPSFAPAPAPAPAHAPAPPLLSISIPTTKRATDIETAKPGRKAGYEHGSSEDAVNPSSRTKQHGKVERSRRTKRLELEGDDFDVTLPLSPQLGSGFGLGVGIGLGIGLDMRGGGGGCDGLSPRHRSRYGHRHHREYQLLGGDKSAQQPGGMGLTLRRVFVLVALCFGLGLVHGLVSAFGSRGGGGGGGGAVEGRPLQSGMRRLLFC